MDATLAPKKVIKIAQLGYSQCHQVLFAGSNMNPTMQSSLRQSLGPLTVLYNVGKQTDAKYIESWKQTAMQQLGHLGISEELIAAVVQTKNQNSPLNAKIGDLLLFGLARINNKAALPMALVLTVCEQDPQYKAKFGNLDLCVEGIPDNCVSELIKKTDLSGKGLYCFYKEACSYTYKMYHKGERCGDAYPELVFHGIFGTHRSDLTYAKFMTGRTFMTRSEIGSKVSGPTDKTSSVQFSLPAFIYVAKMASACQSHLISPNEGQVMDIQVFSGKATLRVDKMSSFFKFLKRGSITGGMTTVVNVSDCITNLDLVIQNLYKKIDQEGAMVRGTTEFFKMEGTTHDEYT
ncbi:hypothetical protein DMENIID0001_037960 [Sergentomyia squamirostris]